MAKFTPGPMVAAVSGSVGGTVFSRNRGGAYTRNRAVPITSTTSFALNAKERFATESEFWQTLTAAQRASWDAFALQRPITDTLGFSRHLTGHQSFVGINSRRAAFSDARLLVPPITSAPTGLTSMSITADIGSGAVSVIFAASPLGAADHLYISCAVTNSAGINYVSNLLRLIGESAAAETTPFDMESLVTARLGTLTVGQTLHALVSVYDDATGLLSLPLRARAAVITT